MNLVSAFFTGVFFCNCIPHLARGLSGRKFPTPFAKPHGVGMSSPLLNFYWGAFNLGVALLLLSLHPIVLGTNPDSLMLAAGALAIGSYLSRHFGKQVEKSEK